MTTAETSSLAEIVQLAKQAAPVEPFRTTAEKARAKREYVSLLSRVAELNKADQKKLAQLVKRLSVSGERLAQDHQALDEFEHLAALAAGRDEALADYEKKRDDTANLIARTNCQVEEAIAERNRAKQELKRCDLAPSRLAELRASVPGLFEPHGPARLLGQ